MTCYTENALLLAALIASIIAIASNSSAIHGSNWRNLEMPLKSGGKQNTLKYSYLTHFNLFYLDKIYKNITIHRSFGFWQNCSAYTNNTRLVEKCVPVDFSKAQILSISRSIYYVGFSFQIIGAILIFIILVISVFNDDFARAWNLYIIFCSAILTLFAMGLYINIITAMFFLSKAKYETLGAVYYFYEISTKSNSFFACLSSIFFSLIVNGIAFFSLSFSANDKIRNSSKHKGIGLNHQLSGFRGGICNYMMSSFNRLNGDLVSSESFRIANQPNFPNTPPPALPPPPLNRQSVSDKYQSSKPKSKTNNDQFGELKSGDNKSDTL